MTFCLFLFIGQSGSTGAGLQVFSVPYLAKIASEWQLQVIDMNKQTIKYYDPQMVRSPGIFRFKETAAIVLTSHTKNKCCDQELVIM
jgi:hypothetical protein